MSNSKGEIVDIARDIVLKAAEGDLQAFEHIYKQTSAFVYNVALKVLRNSEDAQEVTQEVFLKIYKNLKNFDFQSSFKTWVYRIAVNAALNFLRKEKSTLKRHLEYNDNVYVRTEENKIEKFFEQRENEEKVNVLLEALPLEQRVCIVLREIQGLSYEEISRALEVNINTVKSRLKRARETLLKNTLAQSREVMETALDKFEKAVGNEL